MKRESSTLAGAIEYMTKQIRPLPLVLLLLALFIPLAGLTQNQNDDNDNDHRPPLATTAPLTTPSPATKKPLKKIFYHDQAYGSESQFGFLNVFLNVGGILMGRFNYPADILAVDYQNQGRAVWQSLTNQIGIISAYGTWNFFAREVIPFANGSILAGAWAANWGLHFTGEGMLSRKLAEYYDSQNYSHPQFLAALSITTAQMMNEVVEAGTNHHGNIDPIADFYFNLAGIIAFSFDEFAGYFANNNLRINYWPGQPVIDLTDGAIYNHGEAYAWKISLGDWTDWKLFWQQGLPTGWGLSVPYANGNSISYALGIDAGLPQYMTVKNKSIDNAKSTKCLDANENGEVSDEEIATAKTKAGTTQYNACMGNSKKTATLVSLKNPADSESSGNDAGRLTELKTTDLSFVAGVYWDRNESLMASLLLGISGDPSLRLNIFPGLIKIGEIGVGGYVMASLYGAKTFGVTFQYMPVMPGYIFE